MDGDNLAPPNIPFKGGVRYPSSTVVRLQIQLHRRRLAVAVLVVVPPLLEVLAALRDSLWLVSQTQVTVLIM